MYIYIYHMGKLLIINKTAWDMLQVKKYANFLYLFVYLPFQTTTKLIEVQEEDKHLVFTNRSKINYTGHFFII